jgi:hypothetical protein
MKEAIARNDKQSLRNDKQVYGMTYKIQRFNGLSCRRDKMIIVAVALRCVIVESSVVKRTNLEINIYLITTRRSYEIKQRLKYYRDTQRCLLPPQESTCMG